MKPDSKLLIKFPTRGRPDKFFTVLDTYISKSRDLNHIAFLISLDTDDPLMNNPTVRAKLDSYNNKGVKIIYFFGNNKTKTQAINADMEKISGWDILLVASDDMIPVVDGYDYTIREDMNTHFPDMDGVLWYSDGGQNVINTICILGKKYYDRFGYIYHPDYISLCCDDEFTDVSVQLNKVYRSDSMIIEHQHPTYQKTAYDELYIRNESYLQIDRKTYEKRKIANYDLKINKTIFSVLLLGIPERIDKLKQLINKLNQQISDENASKRIEVLALIDNKYRSVGSKRQALLDIAKGKFVAFIDDDDDISDNYISEISKAIEENGDVDVITFNQIAKIDNYPESQVLFSLKHDHEDYDPYRPTKRKPFHMCVWNTRLTKTIKFPDISKIEDRCWIEELCKIAKTEHKIEKFLHFYIFNSSTTTAYA